MKASWLVSRHTWKRLDPKYQNNWRGIQLQMQMLKTISLLSEKLEGAYILFIPVESISANA
jgi:hypothetical protein